MADKLRAKLEKHLKGASAATLDALAQRIWHLPAERAVATIDLGVGVGSTSLRAALELLRAAPDVSPLVSADELRQWGEIGGKLAATNPEVAVQYFEASPSAFARIPPAKRGLVLQFIARQAALSSRTALESLSTAPEVIERIANPRIASEILAICLELARHSVKHSGELLAAAAPVVAHLDALDPTSALTHRATALASSFAHRSGGTAADFFVKVPEVIDAKTIAGAFELVDETELYLERSGSVALQYFVAGGRVLALAGVDGYAAWSALSRRVSLQSNAATYHFLKISPAVVADLARRDPSNPTRLLADVLGVINELADVAPLAAIECFRAAPVALATASPHQFRQWALDGLALVGDSPRRLQAYYALESRGSHEALQALDVGLALDTVQTTLQLYVEGLTGKQLSIASLDEVPEESTIGDGSTVYLPSAVSLFEEPDDNFRLFKVIAAHGAGQIEFGTYERGTDSIRAVVADLLDAFATKRKRPPADAGYADALRLFPNPSLARRIFTTLENGRIDARLRAAYRGIRRDLDFIREKLFSQRRPLLNLPLDLALHEVLLQAAIGGGVRPEGHQIFGKLAGEIERVVEEYIRRDDASVGDTIAAAKVIFELVQASGAEGASASQAAGGGADAEGGESGEATDADATSSRGERSESSRAGQVAHWSQSQSESADGDAGAYATMPSAEAPEQDLEAGDLAFDYDEWDRELGDHRVDWCRIIERRGARGSRSFVELVRSRYSGVISSIRYQFQLMRPENLRRIRGEVDGEEYDLQAVIDYAIDRRATGRVDERLYTRKLRRERDVAVSFLLDMSSSTARTISRFPSQPYSHPGRRIIDIEKEGLVLMSEALEAVGDLYAMHGFTSEGRRNVKFMVFKDFAEPYSAEVEKRIGGITYQNNTRLGTAIRHATAKLEEQTARTKLLIVLSDGRPYDHDYGDSRYAREDTKIALRHAKRAGITPFCITIDRESEEQLRDMYGEVGYTIIDDVLSLPERMPAIYRRLTT